MRRDLVVCFLLGLVILAVYWQVGKHEFVNFDDGTYVTKNRRVQGEIFGMNPKGHHLVNLLLHVTNTVMLFFLLRKMTGALWRRAFVCALFALHPVHVESVAWVAERKDVLSTLFWFLALWAYLFYVRSPGMKRYLLVLCFFGFGLLAKPMLVTLPFVLLLLDYWPLGRLRCEGFRSPKAEVRKDMRSFNRGVPFRGLVLEKVPLLAFSAASTVVTFLAQQGGGAVESLAVFPFTLRLENALVSYVGYMVKAVWPYNLAVMYPHPGFIPLWKAAGAFAVLSFISFLAMRLGRRHPYLPVGWLWYLGTLVPVIGLVQVGAQAMADRYTYVPLIGLFVMAAWGGANVVARFPFWKPILFAAGVILVIASIIGSSSQAATWKDSVTLFRHALRSTKSNAVAHFGLASALHDKGELTQAIYHYKTALQIKPGFAMAHNNLGNALAARGKTRKAVKHYLEALKLNPSLAIAHYNLGFTLFKQGRLQEAKKHFTSALEISPHYVNSHYNLALILASQGQLDEAVAHLAEALRIDPGFSKARHSMERLLLRGGEKTLLVPKTPH